LCLKWRVLPPSVKYQEKDFFDIWICANNHNHLENSCHKTERLPLIPLGTMNTVPPSKNEEEKQLQESVQRYHNRLAEQHPRPQFIPTSRITEFTAIRQTSESKDLREMVINYKKAGYQRLKICSLFKENTKTQKVRPLDDDLKHESVASFDLLVNHRGWKRYTEATDSDVEYISETKIMKKSVQKKVKPQPQRHPATLWENARLAERSQASSWEMERKQSQNLVQECKALIEVETSNSSPDVILVLDKNDTDVSLKQEKNEVSLMKKEKQELCSDTPEIKRNSSLLNWESVPMEDLSPSSGHKAEVSVSGGCKVASSLAKSFQSTSVEETVRKLKSKLRIPSSPAREILLHFFSEFQLPPDFGYTSLEELIASSEIQNIYMIQYEKKLKRKMLSIIYDANRRGVVNEISVGQYERKRKVTEDKLNNLRVKLAVLLQKLQLGGPTGDLEQIDGYLEALLKEDNLLSHNTLN
ncbi:hypothetical protein MC885_013404, partial [Smutsia gigantea]